MEGIVYIGVLWILSAWVFYMIVKAAVRNGILEADDARARKARHVESAAFAKQVALDGLNESRPDQPS